MSDRTKTTVYLPTAAYRRLQALARAQERPTAELVREAVTEYAAAHGGSERPRSLGVGRSGRGDLADRSEDLLDGLGHDG